MLSNFFTLILKKKHSLCRLWYLPLPLSLLANGKTIFSPDNTYSDVLPLRFFYGDWVFFVYTPAAVSFPRTRGAGAAFPLCAWIVSVPYWSYPNSWVRMNIDRIAGELEALSPYSKPGPALLAIFERQDFHRAFIFCCSSAGFIYHFSDQMYS